MLHTTSQPPPLRRIPEKLGGRQVHHQKLAREIKGDVTRLKTMQSRSLGYAAKELKRYHIRLVEILKALYQPETVTLGMPGEARTLMARARELYANGEKRKGLSGRRPRRYSAQSCDDIIVADLDPKETEEPSLPRREGVVDPIADAYQRSIDASIN